MFEEDSSIFDDSINPFYDLQETRCYQSPPMSAGRKRKTIEDYRFHAIHVRQDNPKRYGTRAHERYEDYKAANTYMEYRHTYGGRWTDWRTDILHGYITGRGAELYMEKNNLSIRKDMRTKENREASGKRRKVC